MSEEPATMRMVDTEYVRVHRLVLGAALFLTGVLLFTNPEAATMGAATDVLTALPDPAVASLPTGTLSVGAGVLAVGALLRRLLG